MKNKKEIDYLSFNKGTLILLVGLVLLVFNFIYKFLFLEGASITITSYIQLVSLILIYLGLIFHLMLIRDKPFSKSWNYIKESKKFIYLIVWMFALFALIGFFIPAPDFLIERILEILKELIEKTQGMSQSELTLFIFSNNIKISFFSMVAGVFLGIFPIIGAVVNGYLLGFVAFFSVQSDGFLSLWKILPHGIFELFAVFVSLGLGLKLGTFIFQKNKAESFRNYLWNGLRVFLFIILPLLIIAAIIEGALIVWIG